MFEYSRWAALAAAFAMTTQGYGQDQPKKPDQPGDRPSTVRPVNPERQEVRKLDAAQPGRPEQPQAMQDVLNRYVGTWKVSVRVTDSESATESREESRGKVYAKMALNGRAVKMMARGEPKPGERPEDAYEGMGLLSYNAVARRFESTWADNMGTGIVFLSGQFDEATKTMTMRGDSVDSRTGTTVKTRQVTRWVSDNEYITELYETATDGSEKQTMVFNYTKTDEPEPSNRLAEHADQ